MFNPFRRFLWIVLFGGVVGAPSIAQPSQDSEFDPAASGLQRDPIIAEGLGLKMHIPTNSEIISASGQNVSLTLHDAADPPAWRLQIQKMVMRDLDDPSPRGVAEELLTTFRRGGQEIQVRRNEPRQLGESPAHLLVLESKGEIGGYLIASLERARYLVFRLVIAPEHFDRVWPIIDASFNTVRLTTPEELRAARTAQEERARKAIEQITRERLQSLLGTEVWYRMYQPHATGDWLQDQEVGYYRLTVREGRRGEINSDRDPENFRSSENDPGVLVSVDARYLQNAESGMVTDIQVRLWLNWDRSDEAWNVRATQRQGEASFTEGEHGIRTQEVGYQKILVWRTARETREQDQTSWVVLSEWPYLSQVEMYLLGHLLPREGSIVGTMAFRAYSSNLQRGQELAVRIDEWNPAPDGSGRWNLKSRPDPNLPAVTSIFDRNGNLLRREKADGTITEPIELKRLFDIWKRKGLPTGTD